MTKAEDTKKRKMIDWNKKSGEDSSRITKRMQRRDELKDSAATTNDAFAKHPPKATGIPLLRLRKKIKEVYNEEEDEEYIPLFNINLLEDEDPVLKTVKESKEVFDITKQQQLTGKLSLVMNTALIAEEAGLSPQITKQDNRLVHSAEYDLPKLRRQTVQEKIEKPLGLKGEIPEKDLPKAAKSIKKAKKNLPEDALKDFPAEDLNDLIELDQEDMAKLILKKSGRKSPKKKLSDIAKGLNQFKNMEMENTDNKENA